MKTLHEMAVKLQESIIAQQEDAHNSTTLNVTKYNNLKLKMSTKYTYPHVIITIGISEAIFNIADGTKTDGGLGPDEKYVKKWLGTSTVVADLKEIYISVGELVRAGEENKAVSQEGEADEVKRQAPKKKKAFKDLIEMAMPLDGAIDTVNDENDEIISEVEDNRPKPKDTEDPEVETVEEIKKDLKSYLKAMFKPRH